MPHTGAYYGVAANCPKRPWMAYVDGERLDTARGVARRFSTQAAALTAIMIEQFKRKKSSKDPDVALRPMIEELPADCSNCKKTAYVTAEGALARQVELLLVRDDQPVAGEIVMMKRCDSALCPICTRAEIAIDSIIAAADPRYKQWNRELAALIYSQQCRDVTCPCKRVQP